MSIERGNVDRVKDWNCRHGQVFHEAVQESLEDLIGDPENGVDVHSNATVSRVDDNGEYLGDGRVDIDIESDTKIDIVDFKTDQMKDWGATHATTMGHLYGNQVKEYVNDAPEFTEKPIEGHLVMVGQPPDNPSARAAFEEAAASHGVQTLYSQSDGSPDGVAKEVAGHLGYLDSESARGGHAG